MTDDMEGRLAAAAREPYQLLDRRAEGIAVLWHPKHGTDLWAGGPTRKAHRCRATGRLYPKGTDMLRPMTNGKNRAHRIHPEALDGLPRHD